MNKNTERDTVKATLLCKHYGYTDYIDARQCKEIGWCNVLELCAGDFSDRYGDEIGWRTQIYFNFAFITTEVYGKISIEAFVE